MTLVPSTDYAYFRSVLARPAFRRAAGGDYAGSLAIDAALALPAMRFFEVRSGAARRGFISFRCLHPQVAEVHVNLLTAGRATLRAISGALEEMKRAGIQLFIASYLKTNRAVDRVADLLGFRPAPDLAPFYPAAVREHLVFKELICHN